MRRKATDEQIVEAIRSYHEGIGYSPSMRDLCRILGYVSPNTIRERLQKMRKKGVVDYSDRMARTIVVKGD